MIQKSGNSDICITLRNANVKGSKEHETCNF